MAYSLKDLALYKFYNKMKVTVFSITFYWHERAVTFYPAQYLSISQCICYVCQHLIDRWTYSFWIIIIAIFPKSSCNYSTLYIFSFCHSFPAAAFVANNPPRNMQIIKTTLNIKAFLIMYFDLKFVYSLCYK